MNINFNSKKFKIFIGFIIGTVDEAALLATRHQCAICVFDDGINFLQFQIHDIIHDTLRQTNVLFEQVEIELGFWRKRIGNVVV